MNTQENGKQEHWEPDIKGQVWSSAAVRGTYKGEP